MIHCSKPSCTNVASVVLAYDYAASKAILEDATGDISPHHYAMCLKCAEKLTPPRGWVVDDRRLATPLFSESRPEPDRSFESYPGSDDFDHEVAEVGSGRQLFFGSSA